MQRFLRKPNLEMYAGIRVTKDTELYHMAEDHEQRLENLVFTDERVVHGKNYTNNNRLTIYLEEGDIILFESEERGYVVPVEDFVTIEEAIENYENIKNLDGEGVEHDITGNEEEGTATD